jgi:DNA-binding CsgD family transcriptional regulator
MRELFSSEDLQRVHSAQRALLSPLQHDTPDDWLQAAARRIQVLMGADHVFAAMPMAGRLATAGVALDPSFFTDLSALLGSDARIDRPSMPRMMQEQRRRKGAGYFHELALADRTVIERSPTYQTVFHPHGIRYATGISVPHARGETLICVAYETPDAPGYAPRAGQRLELLVPALEAGTQQWMRQAAAGVHWSGFADATAAASVLFDRNGTERYRNRAFREMLRLEPDAPALVEAVQQLAAAHPTTPDAPAAPVQLHLDLAGGAYRLWVTRAPLPLFDGGGLLVAVERTSPYPPPAALQRRFGLTPRETEVALLLAEGRSNDALAAALSISPHTARHHVQRVLDKLDVGSRAGVAHALLSGSPPH